jgi:hypothetical protein
MPATRVAHILAVVAIAAGLPTLANGDIIGPATDQADAAVGTRRPSTAPPTGASMQLPAAIARFGEAEPSIGPHVPHVAIYRADAPQNFEIDLRLNPTSDAAEGGIALRFLSPRDYYAVRIDGRRERVAFLRVSDGRAEEIVSAERRVAANAWHSLSVRAEGNRFTVTLDGTWLFTAYDATLREAGRLAVWTAPGSGVRFDAIAVRALAPE